MTKGHTASFIRKHKRTLLLTSLLILAAAIALSVYLSRRFSAPTPLPESEYARILSAEKARADAEYLIKHTEERHMFFLDEPSDEYLNARAKLIEGTAEALSIEGLYALCCQYLASLHDAHSYLARSGPWRLDQSFEWKDGQAFLTPTEQFPEGARLLSVADIPIDDLLTAIDSHTQHENESGRQRNRRIYLRYRHMHQAAGVPFADTADLELEYQGVVETITVPYIAPTTAASQPVLPAFAFEILPEEEIALVTARRCELGQERDTTLAALKKALDAGTAKIIFDLRSNPGGNPLVWKEFYETLNVVPPTMTLQVREIGSQQLKSVPHHSGAEAAQPVTEAIANPDIEVVILVNQGSFSSAMHFVAQMSDGKLATIIGQEPVNPVTHYTHYSSFRLANSGLTGRLCRGLYLRPDTSRDETEEGILDIEIPDDEDALAAAVQLLAAE